MMCQFTNAIEIGLISLTQKDFSANTFDLFDIMYLIFLCKVFSDDSNVLGPSHTKAYLNFHITKSLLNSRNRKQLAQTESLLL